MNKAQAVKLVDENTSIFPFDQADVGVAIEVSISNMSSHYSIRQIALVKNGKYHMSGNEYSDIDSAKSFVQGAAATLIKTLVSNSGTPNGTDKQKRDNDLEAIFNPVVNEAE